jgi:hypothetical protein
MIVKRVRRYLSSLRIALSHNQQLDPRATLSSSLAGRGEDDVKAKDEMLTEPNKTKGEETGSRMASQTSQAMPMSGLQATLTRCSETDLLNSLLMLTPIPKSRTFRIGTL